MNSEPKFAFYERRGFQGTVAVIGLLTAIWALVGAPKPWQVASELSASTVVLSNTEIVLDASAASAKRFDGETKLEAAQRAIGSYVDPLNHQGLAFRSAGGECAYGCDLAVGFGADHGEAVREAADEQKPEGRSNIVKAVRAAADDFEEAGFTGADRTNRILVFMNTAKNCGPSAIREIHFALVDSGVDAVRIVALRPSRAEVKKLIAFKQGLASVAAVEISTPATKRQLRHVVKREVKAARKAAAVAKRKAVSSAGTGGESSGSDSSPGGQGGETKGAVSPAGLGRFERDPAKEGRPEAESGAGEEGKEDRTRMPGSVPGRRQWGRRRNDGRGSGRRGSAKGILSRRRAAEERRNHCDDAVAVRDRDEPGRSRRGFVEAVRRCGRIDRFRRRSVGAARSELRCRGLLETLPAPASVHRLPHLRDGRV